MGWAASSSAVSLTTTPNYLPAVLPGWLVLGVGVGLTLPTLVGAATAGLPPHQTSTGSAVVQMGRQIGSVLGVALLVVVIGSSHDDRRQPAPVRARLVVGRVVRTARRRERADHASTEAGVGPYARPVRPRTGGLTLDDLTI